MTKYYAAVDMGASSGRLILGHMENGRMELEEIHRFENGNVNSFLDTCSCIQFFKWNDLVNFFIHSLCTMVAVSDCVTKYLVIFIKKNEVNTPGINAHAYRNLAGLLSLPSDRTEDM